MYTKLKPHFLSRPLPDFVSETPSGRKIAASLGLTKVAENMYVCPSTKDFWRVEGSRLIRMSKEEVDNQETLKGPENEAPDVFLAKLLDELEF